MDAEEKIKELEKKLISLRKKYYIKSFFRKAKRLVTDFLPLDEITSEFCSKKIETNTVNQTVAYLPQIFEKKQISVCTRINPVRIYSLQNICCIPNSTYFLDVKKKTIFYEKWQDDNRAFYLYNTSNLLYHSFTLAKINNFPIKSFDFEAVFLGGIFTFNYYHFFLEILSKTQFFDKIPDLKNKVIILDSEIEKIQNLKMLALFFLKDYKIMFLDNENYYQFRKIWHITSPNYTIPNILEGERYEANFSKFSKNSLDYIRSTCFENMDLSQVHRHAVKKIFVSRKSKFRKYNEDEIFDVAEKHGFEKVFFEELNIHEQIFLISNADYIIGSSGAAWTNLIFANPNAKGLTWLSSVWGDFSVFSTIAKEMQFDLYYYIYPQTGDDFHEDYKLDINTFTHHLKKLLLL